MPETLWEFVLMIVALMLGYQALLTIIWMLSA
jgi:hypothetical protein